MAFFDDREWMLLHIRQCSVVADDTGMSELVITNDSRAEHDVRLNQAARGFGNGPLSTGEQLAAAAAAAEAELDIPATPAIQYHPTMKQGDRHRKGKQQLKNIKWKEPSLKEPIDVAAFAKRDVGQRPEGERPKPKSALSKRMAEVSVSPSNPFHLFARCNGEAHREAIPTHSVDVYTPMCTNRSSPLSIIVLASCSVRDVLGFVMYKYTKEGRKPALKDDLKWYCLRICDDGDVDMEFPPLDTRENIVKFGFGSLAFTELHMQASQKKPSIVITVQMPGSGFSRIQVDSAEILMKDVLSKVLKKRRIIRTGHEYVLEKQNRPGKPVNGDATLSSMKTLEFSLVKENSLLDRDPDNLSTSPESHVEDTLTSHLYQSYQVVMLHKLRANTDVQLGVSGKRLEVDPVQQKRSAIFASKEKPVSYDMRSIVYCEVLEEKTNGRATFRILHDTSTDFKHHDFEADADVTKEIVRKISLILESTMRTERHREFMASRRKGSSSQKKVSSSSLSLS